MKGSTKFSSPREIAQMTSIFDKTTKLSFRDPNEPSRIRFGRVTDRDPKFDVRGGAKSIPGYVIKSGRVQHQIAHTKPERLFPASFSQVLMPSSIPSTSNVKRRDIISR